MLWHLFEKNSSCVLFGIIVLYVTVVGCRRIRILLCERFTDLCSVLKSKVQVICPAGMPGNDLDRELPRAKVPFQFFKRLYRQFVVLRQRADKAVAAVRAEAV